MKLLSDLPTFDSEGSLNVIIETPKGSRNKYAFDPDYGTFELKGVLPEGSSFPFDFGFIPSTRGADGDPLDILVLMDAPTPVGCLLTARPIGVIEAEQKEGDKDVERNDRLLAVATRARTHVEIRTLADLRLGMLDEIEAFFEHYNALSGRRFRPIGRGGPERAQAAIEAGVRGAMKG